VLQPEDAVIPGGQRAAKRQPAMSSRRSGGTPGKKRAGWSSWRLGMLPNKACVYGCLGSLKISST
jgi:hypothetical protein